MSIFKRFANAGKNIFGISTTNTSGKTLASCWQIKQLFGLKSVDSARRIIIGCDFVKNIKTTIKTVDSIFDGEFFVSGNKVGSTIKKTVDTVKDFYTDLTEEPAYAN